MGLVVSLLFWSAQDPGVALPPVVDTSVPLEVPAKSDPAPESKPIALLEQEKRTKLSERPESSGPSLSGFFFWSTVVIALLVGAFLLFKKFAKNTRLFRTNAIIDVLAKRGIGPRQEISLVEIGGRVLILGSTRDRIATLGEIADPDQVARLKAKLAGGNDAAADQVFRDSLKDGLKAYEDGPEPERKVRGDGLIEELAALKKTVSAWRA